MTDAFVLGGVRTPFAKYGSSLSHIRADDLLGMTMKGACERVGVGLEALLVPHDRRLAVAQSQELDEAEFVQAAHADQRLQR